jgi:hypothetical protein
MKSETKIKFLQKWNWGAFLLGPIWALVNQVWVGLIAWLPIFLLILNIAILHISSFVSITFYVSLVFSVIIHLIGQSLAFCLCVSWYFVNVFILGIKGNEMALKIDSAVNKKHFQIRQRILSILGFICGLPLIYSTVLFLDYLINRNANLFDTV